jgi:hypothetical protein
MNTQPSEWQPIASALNAALNGVDDGGVGRSIASALGQAGMQFDADVANFERQIQIRPNTSAYDNYSTWLFLYGKQFNQCATIVTETGGSPPAFTLSPVTLTTMTAAMAVAIATLTGDDAAGAAGISAGLSRQFAKMPPQAQAPVPLVRPSPPSQLIGALNRASAYLAFLSGA